MGIDKRDTAGYTTPTMYRPGDEDVGRPSHMGEAAANVTPGARLERVPRTGHSVYFERPDLFNAALSEFLQDVYPS